MKTAFWLLTLTALAPILHGADERILLEAEEAKFDQQTVEIVEHRPFSGGRGIARKENEADGNSQISFTVELSKPGRYSLGGVAASRSAARELMAKNSIARIKLGLYAMVSANNSPSKRRVAIEPWRDQDNQFKEYQKYDLKAGKNTIVISIPSGVVLDRLELIPYRAPEVPAAARNYLPPVVPDTERPRLWVTPKSLAGVRKNLQYKQHQEIYKEVRQIAGRAPPSSDAPDFDQQYQRIVTANAFVGLVENDPAAKRKAAAMLIDYLKELDFGNELDSFRKTGETIYHASLVYDWCRDQFSSGDAAAIRARLLQLAEEMTIGWPPFRMIVTNGHGNENQVNRDLLSMAIALYGEENLPYQYCAYRIYEELVPIKNEEYRSGRHDQGVAYGVVRLGYEMMAAHLLKRMSGREAFDPSVKKMGYFWLYARLPDGTMLLDGDMNFSPNFWRYPDAFFLISSYAEDPLLKAEFERQGGRTTDPLLYLLLNNPEIRPDTSTAKLPLTRHFDGVLSSMIVRTGWDMSDTSTDAVVECKGGNRIFGNHQHSDAGSFQIYYRGVLATDLGMYGFYGLPYDLNFNKRSIAHNTMLVYDPSERFGHNAANDGGQRFVQNCPADLKALVSDRQFHTGKTIGASSGPDAEYSFLAADLTDAYSKKIRQYRRTFCFLKFDQPGYPGALIVFDKVEAAKPEFKKYFLLNSFAQPEIKDGVHKVRSGTAAGPGMLTTTMVLPADPEITVSGGAAAATFFDIKVTPAKPAAPQAMGYRTMYSPREPRALDHFLTVMQIHDAGRDVPRIVADHSGDTVTLALENRMAVFKLNDSPATEFTVNIPPEQKNVDVLFVDPAPGAWRIVDEKNNRRFDVAPNAGCACLTLDGGSYQLKFESRQ